MNENSTNGITGRYQIAVLKIIWSIETNLNTLTDHYKTFLLCQERLLDTILVCILPS